LITKVHLNNFFTWEVSEAEAAAEHVEEQLAVTVTQVCN
jgi:hypothetical protein